MGFPGDIGDSRLSRRDYDTWEPVIRSQWATRAEYNFNLSDIPIVVYQVVNQFDMTLTIFKSTL